MPHQAFLYNREMHSVEHASQIFQHLEVGVLQTCLEDGDTVIVGSDGVWDNFQELTMKNMVTSAYENRWSPEKLATNIVKMAIANASDRTGKPDDTTAAVGYVCVAR